MNLRNTGLALAWAGATCTAAAVGPQGGVLDQPSAVIGTVGGNPVKVADVLARAQSEAASQQAEYEVELQRLSESRARARHELIERELGKLLDEKALALEAQARGKSTQAVLADVKVPVVTDDEARSLYESRKAASDPPFAQVAIQAKQYYANERGEQAARGFLDGLRAKFRIASQLAPYRVAVDASGPARGSARAPVTIVEFGDFQCPYCAQVEVAVKAVLARHPDDVRLVFRHYPLAQIHPNAQGSALAAVCAGQQGRFWEMHDALYGNQQSLSAAAVHETALRLGLDGERYTQCLADPKTQEVITADMNAGNAAGVSATPAFYVNGRPISGSVPAETFEQVIGDELARRGSGAKVAMDSGSR